MRPDTINIKDQERWLFHAVLIGSVMFWLYSLALNMISGRDLMIVVVDAMALLTTGMLLIAARKGLDQDKLIRIYCFLWLPIFVVNWKYQGGLHGSFSYAYFSILIIFLGLLEKRSRLFMVVLLCLTNLMLTLDHDSDILISVVQFEYPALALVVDYVFHSVIVASVVVFIKTRFDKERGSIETENKRLDRINSELSLKHEELTNQQRQIKKIQHNLEDLVHEGTEELENRNKELESYAYDNAHLVRRPLSNILSLLDLLDNEKPHKRSTKSQLQTIHKNARELDEVVMKINMILK